MSKISNKILDKIDNLKPRPKWHFKALHGLVWGLFGVSIVIGGFAVALVLRHLLVVNDWDLVGRLPGGPVGGFFIVLPYLWFIVLGFMIFAAFKIFEKTEKGYKMNPLIILAISVGLSIVLGSVLFAIKAADGAEDFMRQNIDPYKEFQEFREKVYHAPMHGILPGRIVEVDGESMILMDDVSGNTWKVNIVDANIPPMVKLEVGETIVAVGEETGRYVFKAEHLKPGRVLKDRLRKPGALNEKPRR